MNPKHNAQPLIALQNARVELDGQIILRDLNWNLFEGAHTAITGANGGGKSTFLRLISGQIWPRIARSRFYCFGEFSTHTPLRAREQMALLSPEIQDNYVRHGLIGAEGARGWDLSARAVVASGWFDAALLHQTPDAAQWARADELLAQVELQNLAGRPFGSLSQGQLRRVLLARALVKRPRVLLLDEACSGLDARARAQLLEHIEILAASGQITLVMTTHRADELVPSVGAIWEVCDQTLRAAPKPAAPAPRLAARETVVDEQTPILIQLRNAAVTIEGAPILPPFNWVWRVGEHWAITGANGSGKSTFLRLLRGQIAPVWGGSVERFGSAKRRSIGDIGRDIALLSPAVQARFSDQMPVEDAIGSGFLDAFELWRDLTAGERARALAVMDELEMDDLRGRTFGRLSYGQTRRVLLGRALVTQPKIVLLDEAFDGLDAMARARLGALLGELARRGTHFAFASHHGEDFPAWVNRALKLDALKAVAALAT